MLESQGWGTPGYALDEGNTFHFHLRNSHRHVHSRPSYDVETFALHSGMDARPGSGANPMHHPHTHVTVMQAPICFIFYHGRYFLSGLLDLCTSLMQEDGWLLNPSTYYYIDHPLFAPVFQP